MAIIMLTQLNPPIPLSTPKGDGLAWLVLDYGAEHNLMWVVAIDATGEIWCYQNSEVRAQKNITMGRSEIPKYKNDSNLKITEPRDPTLEEIEKAAIKRYIEEKDKKNIYRCLRCRFKTEEEPNIICGYCMQYMRGANQNKTDYQIYNDFYKTLIPCIGCGNMKEKGDVCECGFIA